MIDRASVGADARTPVRKGKGSQVEFSGSVDTRVVVPRTVPPSAVPFPQTPARAEEQPTLPSPGGLSAGKSRPALTRLPHDAKGHLPRGFGLGRYMIVGHLGSGGLGHVYTAYDPELDRRVAVKLLRGTGKSAEGVDVLQARLRREAQALAKVTHPNVVSVHDVGTAGGQVFLAMELVAGQTLREWCSAQKRTWQEVRDVFLGAGRGLAAAHAAGLVHRDFKPANVLVRPDGRAQVLDFGLARAMSGEVSQDEPSDDAPRTVSTSLDEALTKPGFVMGTPAYMSPEQFKGGSEIDARSDQFSFCVALYQAMYGRRPFAGSELPNIMKEVKAQRFAEPGPQSLRPPAWMRRAIVRGLSTDPAARYPSMNELLDELAADQRARSRRWIYWVTTSAVLFVLGLLGISYIQWREHQHVPAGGGEVDELTQAARAAAARSYFVYPPRDDRSYGTAYRRILELESLPGRESEEGLRRGAQLRSEFADTLARLGDHYAGRQGGRPFALEYYAQALVFKPHQQRLVDIVPLTEVQLAAFEARAAQLDFTEGEINAAPLLRALAVPDPKMQSEELANLFDAGAALTAVTHVQLEGLLGPEVVHRAMTRQRRRTKKPAWEPAAKPETKSEPEPQPVVLTADDDEKTRRRRPKRRPSSPMILEEPAKADRATAQLLVRDAKLAAHSGRIADSEKLFHRALDANPRSVEALRGLAELHFDLGAYPKASRFAKKAARHRPKDAQLRLLLGDAYFKVLRYRDARAQYERAAELGSSAAVARLDRLKRRLGQDSGPDDETTATSAARP